jgi:parallel beta-helix repeat protein
MSKRVVLGIMLTLLLVSTLSLAFNIQPVKASGTIYIRADGSVDPTTTPILTVDNITYTLTGDINDSIVIEKDNIVVDGALYIVEGTGSGIGITLSGRTNVTIQNTTIKAFYYGIYLSSSNNNSVLENNITANNECGIQLTESSYNSVSENNIIGVDSGTSTWITSKAIRLEDSSNNLINGNSVTETTGLCIYLESCNDNILSANVLTNNEWGIGLDRSSNNTLFGNIMHGNKYNYYVYGTDFDHFIHAIDSSNLVDGKPVYYLLNRKDLVINPATYPEIGFLAVINSTNVNIEGLTLTNNSQGLVLAYTSNSRITDNNITDNLNMGIYLQGVLTTPFQETA